MMWCSSTIWSDSIYFVFLDDTILILHRYELYTSQYCSCCHRNDDLYFISLSLARHVKKAFWVVVWFSVFSDLTYSNLLNLSIATYFSLLLCFVPHDFKRGLLSDSEWFYLTFFHTIWWDTIDENMIVSLCITVWKDSYSQLCQVSCLTIGFGCSIITSALGWTNSFTFGC